MNSQYIQHEAIKLNVLRNESSKISAIPILALHGFTGNAEDFNPIISQTSDAYSWHAMDLIGHGKSDSPDEIKKYSVHAQVEQIHCIESFFKLKSYILLGYSMGGRLAMHYALKYPENIRSLVLISASPGIEDNEARKQRLESDHKLADDIQSNGVKLFLKKWQQQEIIATQKNIPEEFYKKMMALREKNTATGLSNSLRMLSPGNTPSNWKRLKSIACPTLILSGDSDKKYNELSEKMTTQMPNASHIKIPISGHCAHLENIDYFCNALNLLPIKPQE